jgi:hypothetical protein
MQRWWIADIVGIVAVVLGVGCVVFRAKLGAYAAQSGGFGRNLGRDKSQRFYGFAGGVLIVTGLFLFVISELGAAFG